MGCNTNNSRTNTWNVGLTIMGVYEINDYPAHKTCGVCNNLRGAANN